MDANGAVNPSDTPSLNEDKAIDESSHETSSSEQNLKAPTPRQDPEKMSLGGLEPDQKVERLAHEDKDEEIVYPTGVKLFLLASVCP